MKSIHIRLSRDRYLELLEAAAACATDQDAACTPEEFARECVECVLASRRGLLKRKPLRARFAVNPERAVRVGHADELEEMTA